MRMGSYGTGFRDRGSHTDCMAKGLPRSAAVKGLSRHILAGKSIRLRYSTVPLTALPYCVYTSCR